MSKAARATAAVPDDPAPCGRHFSEDINCLSPRPVVPGTDAGETADGRAGRSRGLDEKRVKTKRQGTPNHTDRASQVKQRRQDLYDPRAQRSTFQLRVDKPRNSEAGALRAPVARAIPHLCVINDAPRHTTQCHTTCVNVSAESNGKQQRKRRAPPPTIHSGRFRVACGRRPAQGRTNHAGRRPRPPPDTRSGLPQPRRRTVSTSSYRCPPASAR